MKIKPVIKWAGGKGQLLPELQLRFPKELGNNINKYAEPFIGGAAVLFYILNNYHLDEIYISDINAELINLYIKIRDNINQLIEILEQYNNEYINLSYDDQNKYYYDKRIRFNYLKFNNIKDIELAALFIFLNKTCFNGLYRVNKKGEFNVPCGHYKNPNICDKNNLINVSIALKNVNIIHGDYHTLDKFIDNKTFVYFDPPYRPLNKTSYFNSYNENDFNDDSQIKLSEYILELNKRGTYVMISNSDPKNTDINDNFFDDLYKDLIIERIDANRMINSNGDKRNKIKELLIYN